MSFIRKPIRALAITTVACATVGASAVGFQSRADAVSHPTAASSCSWKIAAGAYAGGHMVTYIPEARVSQGHQGGPSTATLLTVYYSPNCRAVTVWVTNRKMVNRSSAYLQHWAGWDRGGRQVHARAGGPAWRYPVKRLLTTDPCIAYQYNETWHNGTLLVNTFRFCAR